MTPTTRRAAARVPVLAALVLIPGLAALPAPAAAQELPTWACTDGNGLDHDEVMSRATNGGMLNIVSHYRDRWSATYVRAQCDAAAAGQPADIGCLEGRRDWDAIDAMIPDDLAGLSASDVRPHLLELQAEGTGYSEAIQHCRELGVIK